MPERNDKCHCGSGKKYKKCCIDRDFAVEKMRLANNMAGAHIIDALRKLESVGLITDSIQQAVELAQATMVLLSEVITEPNPKKQEQMIKYATGESKVNPNPEIILPDGR